VDRRSDRAARRDGIWANTHDAMSKAEALALRVLAARLDHGESVPDLDSVFSVPEKSWPLYFESVGL
jgi:hypothetical protein